MNVKIGFIGYGNMADAMSCAIYETFNDQVSVLAVEQHQSQQDWIRENRSYVQLVSLSELIDLTDIIFLAIKPQQLHTFSQQLTTPFSDHQLLISLLAGVSIEQCMTQLNFANIARIMPNTPAKIQKGVTGVFFPDCISSELKKMSLKLMAAFGFVVNLNHEDEINVITAISGSGPAFFYRMISSFIQFSMDKGLSQQAAIDAATSTMIGAGEMIRNFGSPDALIRDVTSPNGTTQRGLSIMDEYDYDNVMMSVLNGTYERAVELSKEF